MAVPAADRRSDQPVLAGADDAVDPGDTTSILQGAKAFIGKTGWSAGRMAVTEGPIAVYLRTQLALDAKAAEEARQLARLEAWSRETTIVGGVEMTNGEAQEARQHVIDHADAYADWAVAQGKLSESEREEFKRAIRRKMELEDKRGRGTLTAAEEEEARRLDASRAGQAADAATAHSHQHAGVAPQAAIGHAATNEAVRGGGAAVLEEYALFQATQAKPPVAGGDRDQPALSQAVKSTGLAL